MSSKVFLCQHQVALGLHHQLFVRDNSTRLNGVKGAFANVLFGLKEVMKRRPDLKLVVMSATMEAQKMQGYFDIVHASVGPPGGGRKEISALEEDFVTVQFGDENAASTLRRRGPFWPAVRRNRSQCLLGHSVAIKAAAVLQG
ncbi:unnamed protein product [Effrenium voratum]|uniref:Uncharacterized protein n=1 Tax=Effrenium voratum TaxID=2562239 RepID=A0AA36NGI0_9DINO|nr:unnamed protein product [Effrenium voratum]